jgi:AraC-like DNA-binding protein
VEKKTHSANPIIRLAYGYLEAHLDQPVPLMKIAEAAHVSPFYLNRIFRREMGIPPHAFLMQSRIRKSLAVLLDMNSIAETAHALGFSDQSHFTRLFKRNVGITPKRYLEGHRTSVRAPRRSNPEMVVSGN